jgi:hypothetical protein
VVEHDLAALQDLQHSLDRYRFEVLTGVVGNGNHRRHLDAVDPRLVSQGRNRHDPGYAVTLQ